MKITEEIINNQTVYVAEFTGYDIVVQARTREELSERIIRTILSHKTIAEACGLKPFDCIKSTDFTD
jgi:hypothetical protein